jgi:hypothetical protein
MPLFSDFGNKQTRSEDVAAIDSRSTSVSPLDQFLGYAQSTVDSLSRPSPLSEFLSTANQQLGEMFPSVRALPGENILSQGGRLLGQSSLATGPSSVVRAGTKVASDVLQGMGTAADQLKQGDYLGAGLNTVGSALNAPGALLGQTVEEFAGPQAANAPLFNAPVVGDVSARNIAEFAGGFGPQTALERGVGSIAGRLFKSGARQIGQRTAGELAGAGVGGYLGYQNPPSNPLAPSEPGQEPTFGERLAGGVTGAVLGSQVPSVLRAARGLETAPLKIPGAGMLQIKPDPTRNSISQMAQAMGKRMEVPTNNELDALFAEVGPISVGNIAAAGLGAAAGASLGQAAGEATDQEGAGKVGQALGGIGGFIVGAKAPLRNVPVLKNIALLDKTFDLAPSKNILETFVDRYAPLRKLQEYAISKGVDPTRATAYTYARLLAGNGIAATEKVKTGLMPALEGLDDLDRLNLNAYLAMKDTNNKAMMIAQRVRNKYLEEESRLDKALSLPSVQDALSQSPEGQAFLAAQEKTASMFYSLPVSVQQAAANADRRFATAYANAEKWGQKVIDEREFGSITIGGNTVTLKAQAPNLVEQELDNVAGPNAQKIRDAADKVRKYVDSLREDARRSGLVSSELTDYFRQNFPDYVPIDIVDYLDSPLNRGIPSVSKITAPDIIQSISDKGSPLNRDLPLASIIAMTNKIEIASIKNRIANNIATWVDQVPEIASVIRPIKDANEATARDVTFRAFRGGKPVLYAIDKKYQNIIQFEKDALSEWMRAAAILTGSKALTTGATKLNPEFIYRNLGGDTLTYLFRNIAEGKPFKQTAKELGRAYLDVLGELSPVSPSITEPGSRLSRLERATAKYAGQAGIGLAGTAAGIGVGQAAGTLGAYATGTTPEEKATAQNVGGAIGGIIGGGLGLKVPGFAKALRAGAGDASISELRKLGVAGENIFSETKTAQQALQRALGDTTLRTNMQVLSDANGFIGKLMGALAVGGDLISIPFRPISALGEAVERAPRIAQYRLEKAAGETSREAALAARNITMDFDRAGQLARIINTFVPFFNVGVQGADQLFNRDLINIAKNPKTSAAALAFTVMLPSLVFEAWNRSVFPNEFADVPNYLKETGIPIVVGRSPDTPEGKPGGPQFLWIPIGENMKFVQTLFTNAVDQSLKNKPEVLGALGLKNPDKGPPRNWDDVARSIFNTVFPSQVSSPQEITSPVGKTTIELLTNQDLFRGMNIVPDPLHALPPEEQVRPWTTALSRGIGRVLGVSPAKVEYAILNVTGGAGKSVLSGADFLARRAGIQGAQVPEGTSATTDFLNLGRDSIFGRLYREKGDQVNQSTRDATKAALPDIVRGALVNLRSDPEYQAMNPAQQAEESRKLSLAVRRLVLEAQDTSVFESASATGGELKYLTSTSYIDDTITDDAVQTYNAWLRNPGFAPMPSNEVIYRAMLAVKNPVYQYQQKSSELLRQRAINPVIADIPNFAQR